MVLAVSGYVVSMVLAGWGWDRWWPLRFVPVVYCIALALTIESPNGEWTLVGILRPVAIGLLIGLVGVGSLWVEGKARR